MLDSYDSIYIFILLDIPRRDSKYICLLFLLFSLLILLNRKKELPKNLSKLIRKKLFNRSPIGNLNKVFRPSSSPSPIPEVPTATHHIFIPANPTQTLNRHLYHLSPLSPNSSTTSLRNTSTFLPVSIAPPPIVTPTSILRTTTSPSPNNETNSAAYLYGWLPNLRSIVIVY